MPLDIPATLLQVERLYDSAIDMAQAQLPALREELNRLLVANGDKAASSEDDIIDVDADESSDDASGPSNRDNQRRMTQHQRDRLQDIQRMRAAIRDVKLTLHQAWFMKGLMFGKKGPECKASEGECNAGCCS